MVLNMICRIICILNETRCSCTGSLGYQYWEQWVRIWLGRSSDKCRYWWTRQVVIVTRSRSIPCTGWNSRVNACIPRPWAGPLSGNTRLFPLYLRGFCELHTRAMGHTYTERSSSPKCLGIGPVCLFYSENKNVYTHYRKKLHVFNRCSWNFKKCLGIFIMSMNLKNDHEF